MMGVVGIFNKLHRLMLATASINERNWLLSLEMRGSISSSFVGSVLIRFDYNDDRCVSYDKSNVHGS